MIAFGYIRVSSKSQADGDGPARQRDSIAKFCKLQGLNRRGNFFDAITGTSELADREGFQNLLRRAEPFPNTCLVVERMDRLARDLIVSELLFRECRERNIKVFAADRGDLIDIAGGDADPTRTLMRQILGALAQWEKAVIVMKTRAARERKRKETGRCEGKLPYGSRASEVAILAQIKFRRDQGQKYKVIAKFLNDQGLYTKHGKVWTGKNARYALVGEPGEGRALDREIERRRLLDERQHL